MKSFEVSQSSRQAETTSTRLEEVIDTTRQRQHRQDHENGHRCSGGNRRQVIDKLEPVELFRGPTHSTGHVPTGINRPATIHREHPTRLHLDSKRRTTSTVQPLLRGNVDHDRLRRDKHSFPSRTLKRFRKDLIDSTFFLLPSLRQDCRKRGSQGSRAITTTSG